MTQTEAALVIIMFCMIALVLLKDTGHLAGTNLLKVRNELSNIYKNIHELTMAVNRLNQTIKITETNEKESWALNENLEWEKEPWRKQENI